MFEDAGGKLKKVADCLLWLGIIASVILAFVFGITKDRYGDNEYHWNIILGVLIGGSLGTYIECLLLAAFGDLVESAEAVYKMTKRTIEKMNSTPGNLGVNATHLQGTGSRISTNRVTCPRCGRMQDARNTVCIGCGERL